MPRRHETPEDQKKRIAWLLSVGFVGFLFGAAVMLYGVQYREYACRKAYDFINKSVVCNNEPQIISKAGYASLKSTLISYIEAQKAVGVVTDVAVYYRDLKNGPIMGINETADFAPASLLKTPLALMYLAREDESPGFLSSQPLLRYSLSEAHSLPGSAFPALRDIHQAFPPPEEIQEGNAYEVKDLLFRLLAYSDNRANELLAEHALATMGGEDALVATYRDLGMIESESLGDEVITVRSYSSMFRLLFNANYLSPAMSEQALAWLAQSSFTLGLVAGVPEGIVVAHKFGEREVSGNDQQLHDCGIVYYPDNPYLLCVMTKGRDVYELARVIAEISRMTYEEVDRRRL